MNYMEYHNKIVILFFSIILSDSFWYLKVNQIVQLNVYFELKDSSFQY